MCLSTHRASVKKVWERFYVGEKNYPLSKSHCVVKSAVKYHEKKHENPSFVKSDVDFRVLDFTRSNTSTERVCVLNRIP